MHKRRRSGSEFNPEKFLAADLKKKVGPAFHSAEVSIRPPLVVLSTDYVEKLYARLKKERPQLLAVDFTTSAELATSIVEFLKGAFLQDELKVGSQVFAMLYLDFLRELAKRRSEDI